MKILAITSIRSDYDLLSPFYRLLDNDKNIDLKLLVSGAHLSKEFGYSKNQILNDGFDILIEIETLINSDSVKSRLKTASLLLQNSIDIVDNFNPDIILYAGDREDVIIGGLLGMYLEIPTIHFYGGDHEEDGHQDTYIRHATSKLSTAHFVSTEEHKLRLMALGESSKRIFNIGSISLDKFNDFNSISLESSFDKKIPQEFALLIFHPITGEDSKAIFLNIIKELEAKNIFTFVSYPNTDPMYDSIIEVINDYINHENFFFYKNLDRDLFLTIFSKCKFMIGNSSAGIHESATIQKPVLNVGMRQKSRMAGKNVLFCGGLSEDISISIDKLLSKSFLDSMKFIVNPYGDGKSAKRAYELIKSINFKTLLPKVEDPLGMVDNEK